MTPASGGEWLPVEDSRSTIPRLKDLSPGVRVIVSTGSVGGKKYAQSLCRVERTEGKGEVDQTAYSGKNPPDVARHAHRSSALRLTFLHGTNSPY